MKFGPLPLSDAEGAIAAHSVRLDGGVIKKGTRLGRSEIARLAAAGFSDVIAAHLEPGDVPEDVAARTLAEAVAGAHVRVNAPFTGRANLYADVAGVLRVSDAALDAFNGVDEAITLATLRDLSAVAVGDMVGTVKIIPYGVSSILVEAAAREAGGLLAVAPFRLRKVGVISTLLPGLAAKVVEKTLAVTRARLAPTGAVIRSERRTPHEAAPLAQAIRSAVADGAELVIVFGASAIADRNDVIPSALVAAGGEVVRLGMPVDPGNLLMLGRLGTVPVLGAPGCARSPKENGFDFILARLLAGLEVTSRDIARMGPGGLLTDIAARPHPRAEGEASEAAGFAAVILAAGRSSRMGGGVNKLVAEVGGVPVIRRVAQAALASRARPVIVVTGHEGERIGAALSGLDVRLVHNADYATGMASSLRMGIAAVPETAAGALVVLGDMPLVGPDLLDRLMAAHAPDEGRFIAVPVEGGQRGHPVLWSRRYFADLGALEGDVGARHVLAANAEVVAEVAVEGAGAFLDVDTPHLLAEARAVAGKAVRTEPA
ncbi:molybdopterin-binding/glycosyltransferase family 2 protein [Xanthobacter dioxanivorans]|uniref:Molybdopterin-binding/glycosyltransferase family 2 protein n=1 Tax=Xanthobacter dioxanivorans TaxID=2528964 RepID=A0A974PKW8_9HYPH|nr:molybdopterin-binding/glycosyltransferase family 2 protein [Xanthobacter dioxanivorans]QRG05181.1 molybdopterin-binding/glycosyltransferase family 2 protein [Xanthobacter dioxanivorans]